MFRISTLEPFQDHQDPCANAPWKVVKMDEDGPSHELFNIKNALFRLTCHLLALASCTQSQKASFCCITGVASQAQQTGSN